MKINLFEKAGHSFERDLFDRLSVAKARDYIKSVDEETFLADLKAGGNVTAVTAFMLLAEPAIMSVFWKNFMGTNGKAVHKRMENGAYNEFCSTIFTNLVEPTTVDEADTDDFHFTNPFLSFDESQVNGELIPALIGWVKRYIKSWAIKINNKNKMSAESDVSYEQRYEELGDSGFDNGDEFGASEPEQNFIDDDIIDSFYEMAGDPRLDVPFLKNGNPASIRDALIALIENPDLGKREIAKKIGVSINALALGDGCMIGKLRKIMSEYDIGPSEFAKVLKTKDKSSILTILKAK